jgi:class 3 adenylate cyclase
MAGHTWSKARAEKRIDTYLGQVKTVEIKDYVRDTDLGSLPNSTAYRVSGVHLYVDILNIDEMLGATTIEGVTCHKRTLRFLNLHFRAVHRILGDVDAIEVDFHNQRLHAVFAKPYDDEAKRVHRAVATGQLIADVLAQTGETGGDEIIPAAKIRIGIDSGTALAVNNGRRGHREPLFLGEPANHAAKRASGGTAAGIYLTNKARTTINLTKVCDENATALTTAEVETSNGNAKLNVTADAIVKAWRKDLEANPIGAFEFSGHTPPLSSLDLELLTPANSRRQDAMSLYADIDGFTAYVAAHIGNDDSAKDVVRALHVIRSELDAVLSQDFGGRKVRFIGDCIHGALVEGTAQTTNTEDTASTSILCAGALRSSFDLTLVMLAKAGVNVDGLGLAIGFDFGPLALTRLGMKGSMVRCAVGRNALQSEAEQKRCAGHETAAGANAVAMMNDAGKAVFGITRKRANLTYQSAVDELAAKQDKTALATKSLEKALATGGGLLQPTSAAASDYSFPPRNATPTKPEGFA